MLRKDGASDIPREKKGLFEGMSPVALYAFGCVSGIVIALVVTSQL